MRKRQNERVNFLIPAIFEGYAPKPEDFEAPPARRDRRRMTADEELRSLLQWAERHQLENVAASLRRVLQKLAPERVDGEKVGWEDLDYTWMGEYLGHNLHARRSR